MKIAELRQLLSETEQRSARIDARGLPVVGFGILLSGIPDELASMPPVLDWAIPIIGVFITVTLVVDLIRSQAGQRDMLAGP